MYNQLVTMKRKLTFFQMMYCWMFVYLSFFKYKRDTPANFSCTMLSAAKMMNLISIYVALNNIFAFDKGQGGLLLDLIIIISLFIIDNFLFFHRRDMIFAIFADYSVKEKLRGRTYFWIYIATTVLLLGLTVYLTQIVDKPLLAV